MPESQGYRIRFRLWYTDEEGNATSRQITRPVHDYWLPAEQARLRESIHNWLISAIHHYPWIDPKTMRVSAERPSLSKEPGEWIEVDGLDGEPVFREFLKKRAEQQSDRERKRYKMWEDRMKRRRRPQRNPTPSRRMF